jgi:formiminotetrahydrofolate cyclodeaminase
MKAQPSVWKSTLEEFDAQITQGDSIIGAVAVASVSAALAVGVLRMVLEVTARKKESQIHRGQLQKLLDAANVEAERLRRMADDDRDAYSGYREALRLPREAEQERTVRQSALRSALEHATETPLRAARAAVQALELCVDAATLAKGDVAADIGGAAEILNGAVRAILNSVDTNLSRMEDEGLAGERRELGERARRYAEQVRDGLKRRIEKGGRPLL